MEDTTFSGDPPITPPPSKLLVEHTNEMNSPSPLSGGGGAPTYGMTPEQASKNFDVLRREATKLERHLEDRVARYQQVRVCLYCCARLDESISVNV